MAFDQKNLQALTIEVEQVMNSYKNSMLIISNQRLEKCCALRKIMLSKKY